MEAPLVGVHSDAALGIVQNRWVAFHLETASLGPVDCGSIIYKLKVFIYLLFLKLSSS